MKGIFNVHHKLRKTVRSVHANFQRNSPRNRPFHGFFSFSQGPVWENPSTLLERGP